MKDKVNLKSKKSKKYENLIFIFKDVNILMQANPEIYDEKTQKRIQNEINAFSKEIHIDYTYVDFQNTPFSKTFMNEDGWIELCNMLKSCNYGKKMTKQQSEIIHETYCIIIIQYMMQMLDDIGYDISNIHLEIKYNSKFKTEIHKCNYIDNYKGKWQQWKK